MMSERNLDKSPITSFELSTFQVLSEGWDYFDKCWQEAMNQPLHNKPTNRPSSTDINPQVINPKIIHNWATLILADLKTQQTPLQNWHNSSELSLTWLNLADMAKLNLDYLQNPKPTDVLSFSLIDSADNQPDNFNKSLGDVVICPDVAINQSFQYLDNWQADESKTPTFSKILQARIAHLFIHGVLHLLGFDHQNTHDASKMQLQEKRLLQVLGFRALFFKNFYHPTSN